MFTSYLDGLAQAHGIALAYTDASGKHHQASEAAKIGLLKALGIPIDGVSQLAPAENPPAHVSQPPTSTTARDAYLPAWLEEGRAWGATCQLYSIRSSRNEGIGDFEDLARLAELLGQQGADFLGVNPIHALFLSDPTRFSPYSPSSRRFVTPIYIATDRLELGSITRTGENRAGSNSGFINYAEVLARKRELLETAFGKFRRFEFGTGSPLDIAFGAFRDQHGQALEDFSLFEVLSENQVALGHSSGWLGWPSGLKSRTSAAVAAFSNGHSERILFHTWLQWIADRQLAEAQRRAVAAGMRIGLYLDIAVGVAPDGADTWCAPDEVLATARIGAPPDAFNVRGQDWGLAPISPRAASTTKNSAFGSVIVSAMRHAGAIRLDHAMSLTRLYLIPDGNGARDGAYVAYPLDELLDIICTASAERRVIVIGEDLGTVPDGFREAMRARGIQGYRVLIFEHTSAGFRPPCAYDREALACIGTHDLPTLFAWW
ncbi:MAG: 4-alpha-glucanotransferase, partial [Hyphomicrobiaceae bacterium]